MMTWSAVPNRDKRDMTTNHIFQSLGGPWTLRRLIITHLEPRSLIKVTGEARFSPLATDMWLYEETGEAIISGERHHFSQAYRYQHDVSSASIQVCFARGDRAGKHFHELLFAQTAGPILQAQGQHLCGQDQYQASYAFHLADLELASWFIAYSVQGPRKHYTSRTYLRRA